MCGTLRAEGTPVPSHETIYRHIRRDKRAGGVLHTFTRIMSKKGRKRYRSPSTRGLMPGKRHISQRPAQVEEQTTPLPQLASRPAIGRLPPAEVCPAE